MVQIYNPEMFAKVTGLTKTFGYNVEVVGEPDYLKVSGPSLELIIQLKKGGVELFYLEQYYGFASIKFDDTKSELEISTDIDDGLVLIKTRDYHNHLSVPEEDLERFLRNPGLYTFEQLGENLPISSTFYAQMKKLFQD